LSLSSIDIYIWLLCILIFGSNIVGPTCSREGRVGEAGRRDAQAILGAATTNGWGPPEAVGGVTVGPQSLVFLCASVLGKAWSHGDATGATPSTTTGATPSTTTGVLSSTRSASRYFSGELLWTLLFFLVVTYNDFIQMLKTLYIHFCQFDHVSYGTTWHVSGHRAVRRYFLCGPTFVLWLFLQVMKTSQCRGGVVEISNWHFKFYAGSIGDIKWWACSIRRVPASSADSLGWDAVGATWLRPGLQQPPHSSLGMPQASGWVPWPQQPPTGRGGVEVPIAAWAVAERVSSWT
jgi:hypothetical protein